ncbi:MAG: AraC family transcriptional regulator [Ruminiclostridium sp.]|nr:AraC family transcriptional regulator [Ruminiclostridium sp.]
MMKNRSLFIKFFMILVLFVAIPVVLISIVFSYQILSYSEGEISKSAAGKLKVARNLCDMIADKLEQDSLEISLGNQIEKLKKIHTIYDVTGNPDEILNIYEMQLQLLNFIRSNKIIHSAYFYIQDSDFVITSNRGISRLQFFADTEWLENYQHCVTNDEDTAWLPTRTVNYSLENQEGEQGSSNKVITCLHILKPYTTRVKGVLVINIYESSIRELINDKSTLDEGNIEIITPEGNVISHVNEFLVGTNIGDDEHIRQILDCPGSEGYLIRHTGKGKELVTFYKSDFYDWIYVGTFSVDNLLEKVNRLRQCTIYLSLFLMLLGVFISWVISKKLYNPIRRLIQDIKSRKGIDIKSGDTELTILSKAFDSLIQQQSRLSDILEKSAESINEGYVLALLEGKAEQKPDIDTAQALFPYDYFICAVILVDNYKAFMDNYTAEQRKYIKMLIIKVSEELLGTPFKCFGIAYEKHKIVLVINFDAAAQDLRENLVSAFIKLQGEISKVLDYTVSIGVGNCVHGAQFVDESFDNASDALKLKILTGYGSIHLWNEPDEEDERYFYPYLQEKHIFNNIQAGLMEKMQDSVNDFILAVKQHRCIGYDNVVLIFNQLIGNTMKYLLDMHCNVRVVLGDDCNLYQELASLETLDEIQLWLNRIYEVILNYFQKGNEEKKSPFEKALDYIHMNYRHDFEMGRIADHIGISYSHFRRIFREHTGDNVINYINSLRINESKRMLCQTSLTINDIALDLGYNSSQTFTRFFKKYEGITPGEFRTAQKGG